MLNHFDTVFAFIAVLAGVSLIVTTLTQTMGALFAFRGRHLRWGLSSLVENYAPEIRQHAEALSGHLLNHPLVSDSMFSRRGWVPLNVVTGAVHFLWRGWKFATAVRPEELRAIVANLSENVAGIVPEAQRVLAVIGAAKRPEDAYDAVVEGIEKLAAQAGLSNYWIQLAAKYRAAFGEMKKAPSADPEAKAQLVKEVKGVFEALASVGILGARLEPETRTSAVPARLGEMWTRQTGREGPVSGGLPSRGDAWDRWFDSTMDRVSQRFGSNMRIWTVAFSFLLAFAGGLDSLALYKKLSSDAELRAKLIVGADAIQSRFETLTVGRPAPGPAVLLPGEEVEALKKQVAQVQSMLEENEKLGIFLGSDAFRTTLAGFFGCLASAILLSLGAPFWFNALKRMANLRPLLANKTENRG